MREKLLTLLLMLLVYGNSFAQYESLLNDNPSWIMHYLDMLGDSGNFAITQVEDVVVGDYTYKKFIDPYLVENYLVREDVGAKKVYKRFNNNDVLLFDFSLNLADQIQINGKDFVVESITNVNVNGGQRRQWRLRDLSSFPGPSEIWIEGVGSIYYPLSNVYQMVSDPTFSMKCSFKNDVSVFNQGIYNNDVATDCQALGVTGYDDAASKISLTPNPFRTELTINTLVGLQDATINVYNMIGQMVKQANHLNGNKIVFNRENLNPGIYLIQLFQNGKLLASKKVSLVD